MAAIVVCVRLYQAWKPSFERSFLQSKNFWALGRSEPSAVRANTLKTIRLTYMQPLRKTRWQTPKILYYGTIRWDGLLRTLLLKLSSAALLLGQRAILAL